ncbi:hypothetical protein ON010_g18509 [Phytophthora cinnamomi]|nr:hypothetical protein ON010_g18509 [Phytophthora cinnamomi]
MCDVERVFRCGGVDVKHGCAVVDDLFFMLRTVVLGAVELLDCGYDVEAVQDQCAALKSSVDEFVSSLNCQTAVRYRLPESRILQQLHEVRCDVQIVPPEVYKDSKGDESCENRRLRALGNLAGCRFIDASACSLEELLEWVQAGAAAKSQKHNLILRTVENFMFKSSVRLNSEFPSIIEKGDSGERDIELMQALVTEYLSTAGKCHQLPRKMSILAVEQRSREMLVLWIAFCLVHRRCVAEVPLCGEYNIALSWKDLKVAVLRDEAAIYALQSVAQYIRAWNTKTLGPALFHLTDQTATLDFARAYGLSSTSMNALYDRDIAYWEAHMKRKWQEIERKKQEAARLREEIRSQEQLWRLNQNLRKD